MGFHLAGPLESAIRDSVTARTKIDRIAAAAEVARLLREGAPLTAGARDALARLFAGELRRKMGRPAKPVNTAGQELFRRDFESYYAVQKGLERMDDGKPLRGAGGWDAALARFAALRGVEVWKAREWLSTRRKSH